MRTSGSCIRVAVAHVLRDAGYAVHVAPNGEPALHWLRKRQEGVVMLIDLRMPNMGGNAFLQAVAEDDTLATRHARMPMTANVQTLPQLVATLLTALRVPVLAKPFDIDDLLAMVRQAEQRLDQGGTLPVLDAEM